MSKPAPLIFPKKGQATPPPDAVGRAAEQGAPAPIAAGAQRMTVTIPANAVRGPIQGPGEWPAEAAAPATRRKTAARAPAPAAAAAPPAGLDLAGLLEGGDDLVQINVTVPRRIRNQLHLLKLTGQAGSIKSVTTEAVTKAVEQLLAGQPKAGKGAK